MTRPELTHDVRIADTTLRDGSHAMAHQFTETQVRDTVRALDRAGVEVIEVTHGDGLGGSSFNYGFSATDELTLIAAAREEAQQAKIAVLLVPGIGTADDLQRALDAGRGDGAGGDPLHRGRRLAAALRRGARAGHGDRRVPDDGAPDPAGGPGEAGPDHGRRRLPGGVRDRLGRARC